MFQAEPKLQSRMILLTAAVLWHCCKAAKLLKLRDGVGISGTPGDIVDNPKNRRSWK